MGNDFERRYGLAIRELEGSGMRASSYLPPIQRLLRMIGMKTRPPHYNSLLGNVVLMGLPFGVGFGAVMWFMAWSGEGLPLAIAAGLAAMAGVLFGLAMGAYYQYSARKHGLSKWEELEGPVDSGS